MKIPPRRKVYFCGCFPWTCGTRPSLTKAVGCLGKRETSDINKVLQKLRNGNPHASACVHFFLHKSQYDFFSLISRPKVIIQTIKVLDPEPGEERRVW